MSKYIKLAFVIFLLALISSIVFLSLKNQSLQESIRTYDNNFKALNLENSDLRKEAIAYKFSVEQLEYINDSIIKDLNNTRKVLGIKDAQIRQMQNIKTEIHTVDTLIIRDTIFKESFNRIDTLLGDKWHTIRLELEYPNIVKTEASFNEDLDVFAYTSKEIIGVPKKCCIGRLFQKKNKVIRVEVNSNNPHSIIKEKKFIIIE